MYKTPHNRFPDKLAVMPFPLGGNPDNTSERLEATVAEAGIDVLGVHVAGTGRRAIIDLGTRAVSRARFSDTCALDAERIEAYKKYYDELVGWGDSGRGSNIMRMQLVSGIFGKLLLRDGINVEPKGIRRFKDFLLYNHRQESPQPGTNALIVQTRTELSLRKIHNVVLGAAEIANYIPLLASTDTLDDATQLAADTSLPMRIVMFSDTYAGSREAAYTAIESLTLARYGQNPGIAKAAFFPQLIEARHEALLYPSLAAQHLQETLRLDRADEA